MLKQKSLKKYFFIFFFCFSFKTVDTQMLFWSIYFKMYKKKLITAKNGQTGVFDG